jgi:hypothetical protein
MNNDTEISLDINGLGIADRAKKVKRQTTNTTQNKDIIWCSGYIQTSNSAYNNCFAQQGLTCCGGSGRLKKRENL